MSQAFAVGAFYAVALGVAAFSVALLLYVHTVAP